jgi:hypothetical protein
MDPDSGGPKTWGSCGSGSPTLLENVNVILKKSPINIISPVYFQLSPGKNGKYNISSKNHLES